MLAHLALAAVFALPGPSGLDVKVRVADPARPVIVLTNQGDRACQAALTSLGTVAFANVEQDGKAIEPIPVDVGTLDGFEEWLTERLQTLEPGKSAEVPLRVVDAGPAGQALEMVAWSPTGGTYGVLYPIAMDRPLSVELTYSVPLPGAEVCAAAVSSGNATASAGGKPWLLWAAIAAAAVLLILLATFLLRRRRTPAAAAILLLLASGVGIGQAAPARADYDVAPELRQDFDECMALFREPGNDPAGILDDLDGDYHVHITYAADHFNYTTVGHGAAAGNSFVHWDPDERHRYHGTEGYSERCSTLYHELHHAWQGEQGIWSMEPCATSDGRELELTEVLAVHAQNRLREALGMPPRTHHRGIPVPDDCVPPGRGEQCESGNCGGTTGEPHILTYDNRRYDFQAAGEFILTQSGGYQVQVRQQPVPGRQVSMNTATAMAVGDAKVEIRATPTGLVLLIAGQVRPLQTHRLAAGEVRGTAGGVVVSWRDGPTAFVTRIGVRALNIAVEPAAAQLGKLEGILGDFDGNSANDIRPRGGSPIEPTFEALYPSFADSWRIAQARSLFTYEPGESTETFTDRTFPSRRVDPERLPGRAAAQLLCERRGVTDPAALSDCVLDVALTGDPDFAVASAQAQFFAAGGDFGGELFAMVGPAFAEFESAAGRRIFIDVPITTVADACGVLRLSGPDGRVLRTGCVRKGTGFIDTTALEAAGNYTVTLTAPGEARLRVITVPDATAAVTLDAKPSLARLDKPGMVGRYTFSGTKDQKVYVDVSQSSLPDQCGVLSLRDPDGREIRGGCVGGGAGNLDGTVLPRDGTYTVEIDPRERTVGDLIIKLYHPIDQRAALTAGTPLTARIQQPGAAAFLTFEGTTGQRIRIQASAATLPGRCGVFRLVAPDGGPTITGCLAGGKGGLAERDGYVLRQTGTYTLVVDPTGNATGDVVLRLS